MACIDCLVPFMDILTLDVIIWCFSFTMFCICVMGGLLFKMENVLLKENQNHFRKYCISLINKTLSV